MMSELLAHLTGDYLVQSDWMADQKTKAWLPAAAHSVTYTVPFLALTRRWQPLAVIAGTHYVIDRYRLAKYVVWAKNQAAPELYRHPWDHHTQATGYHREFDNWAAEEDPEVDPILCEVQSKPPWMSTWLMIIADNTMHGLINHWALRRWAR
jgi:hypothetical protein